MRRIAFLRWVIATLLLLPMSSRAVIQHRRVDLRAARVDGGARTARPGALLVGGVLTLAGVVVVELKQK
jgi:drug/metabolite transporter (DMT)-like permease